MSFPSPPSPPSLTSCWTLVAFRRDDTFLEPFLPLLAVLGLGVRGRRGGRRRCCLATGESAWARCYGGQRVRGFCWEREGRRGACRDGLLGFGIGAAPFLL
jgi:hypothetical protein